MLFVGLYANAQIMEALQEIRLEKEDGLVLHMEEGLTQVKKRHRESGEDWRQISFRAILEQSELGFMQSKRCDDDKYAPCYACRTMTNGIGEYLPTHKYFLGQNNNPASKRLHDAFEGCMCSLPVGKSPWQPGDGTDPLGTAILGYIEADGNCDVPENGWKYIAECRKYLQISKTAKWIFARGLPVCSGHLDGLWSCVFETDHSKLCGKVPAAVADSKTCHDFKHWLQRYTIPYSAVQLSPIA
jgi:hypothetical protein